MYGEGASGVGGVSISSGCLPQGILRLTCMNGVTGLQDDQAKIESSSEVLMISSWSLRKARSPSPYKSGMFMSKRPKRQYAISSFLVVVRSEAQDILSPTRARRNSTRSAPRYMTGIDVRYLMCTANVTRLPIGFHVLSRKITSWGGKKLLESPTTAEPAAERESHSRLLLEAIQFDILKVCIANNSLLVPAEHRVDSL